MSIDHAGRPADVHAVAGGQVDQPRLFGAGDDLDPDAGEAVHLGNEVAAVVRFAGGAGGGRDDLVDLVRFGQALELRQRLERGRHGGRRDAPAVEAAGAEPDHILFPVDDLEGEIRPDLHHDHVDRVRADVDGR